MPFKLKPAQKLVRKNMPKEMMGPNFKVRLNIYFIWKRLELAPVDYV